jgi:hypothetical protein
VEIAPNDAVLAPRSLDVIKPARFARNYPVFAGLQLALSGKALGDFPAHLFIAGHELRARQHEGF